MASKKEIRLIAVEITLNKKVNTRLSGNDSEVNGLGSLDYRDFAIYISIRQSLSSWGVADLKIEKKRLEEEIQNAKAGTPSNGKKFSLF